MLKDLFVVDILLPQMFITDKDIALMNTIDVVFPSTLNLFCRFNISKSVGARYKKYVTDRQKSEMDIWCSIVDSPDEIEYYQRL